MKKKEIGITALSSLLSYFFFSLVGLNYRDRGWFWCRVEGNSPLFRNYDGDTVSTVALFVISIGSLLALISIEKNSSSSDTKGGTLSRILEDFWIFLAGFTLCMLFNVILKTFIPEPRPHFLHTCNPDPEKFNCSSQVSYVPFTADLCRFGRWKGSLFTKKDVMNALMSFPSGHAQISVYSMSIAMYYTHTRLKPNMIWMVLLDTMWLGIAIVISISRIIDGRHHWWDVLAGGIIGLLLATISIKVFPYHTPAVSEQSKGEEKQNSIKSQ